MSKAEVSESCSSCKFWHAADVAEGAPPATAGECRAHPPQVVVHATITGAWAATQAADWCGEFAAAPAKHEAKKHEAHEGHEHAKKH